MVTVHQIKETKTFQGFNHVQKIIMVKSKSLKDIKLGLNMSKLTSFENWVEITSPRENLKNLVKELLSV